MGCSSLGPLTGAAEWGCSGRLGHIPRAMLGLLGEFRKMGLFPGSHAANRAKRMLGGLGGCGDAILAGDRGRSRAL